MFGFNNKHITTTIMTSLNKFSFQMVVAYERPHVNILEDYLIPRRLYKGIQSYIRGPADAECFFETLTKYNVVIMGRKTFMEIPSRRRVMPNRTSIVITRNPIQSCFKEYQNVPNLFITKLEDLPNVLSRFTDKTHVVIGGRDICKIFLPYTDRIYGKCMFTCAKEDATDPDPLKIDGNYIKTEFKIKDVTEFRWCVRTHTIFQMVTFVRLPLNIHGLCTIKE